MAKGNGFIGIEHDLVRSQVWRDLSSNATRLLIDIWDQYNGRNNGDVPYSVAQAVQCLHCSKSTAIRTFAELREATLIERMHKGSFAAGDRKGESSKWRLTFLQ